MHEKEAFLFHDSLFDIENIPNLNCFPALQTFFFLSFPIFVPVSCSISGTPWPSLSAPRR